MALLPKDENGNGMGCVSTAGGTNVFFVMGGQGVPGSFGEVLGLPKGGNAGQVLTKKSSTDGDAEWQDIPGGGAGGVGLETLASGWLPFGKITIENLEFIRVEDTPENKAIFIPGRALKTVAPLEPVPDEGSRMMSRADGEEATHSFFCVVDKYDHGEIRLIGPPLPGGEQELFYGTDAKTVQVDLSLPGQFARKATTQALKDGTGSSFVWQLRSAHLVGFSHQAGKIDSAATESQAKINIRILGAKIFNDDLQALAARKNTAHLAKEESYGVRWGDELEVEVVQASGGTPKHDAENWSASLIFVSE